jgi:hypothetical protein
MAGATIRVGGLSAGGHGVGLGVGVGVGGRAVGEFVAVGSGGRGVAVAGSAGVNVALVAAVGWVGKGVAVGLAVGVDVAGPVVGLGGAVSASTTAPASVMTGGGGAWTRIQTAQPNPVAISSPPTINMPFERAGTALRIDSLSLLDPKDDRGPRAVVWGLVRRLVEADLIRPGRRRPPHRRRRGD